MTYIKSNYSLFAILFIIACGQSNLKSKGEKNDSDKVSNHIDNLNHNQETPNILTPDQFTPLSLINAVTLNKEKDSLVNVITLSDNFPIDWVKSTDLDTLITLIKSTIKTKCLVNYLSSNIPTNNADIGGYAISFINSFRNKTKIKIGLYNCPKTNKESVEEIMIWWANYKHVK